MRHPIIIILAVAFLLSSSSSSRPATSDLSPLESPSVYVAEGIGIEGVAVGHSTANSVVAKYGEDFELVKHNWYSYEMEYEELGLSFWYRQEDKAKKIFCITIKPPCRGFTARGIVVGESTLQDVFSAYGKTEFHSSTAWTTWSFQYPGVEFHIDFDPKDKVSWKPEKLMKKKVIAIDIVVAEPKP